VIFAASQVVLSGTTARWDSSADYHCLFCPACGSRVASLNLDEVEFSISSFDNATAFSPQYESWTIRRLPWIAPLDVPQFDRDRIADGPS
jgi:hypothetical protein